MLHWNSWWVEPSAKASSNMTGLPSAFPFDATSWTPEAWIGWQQNWWDQSMQASMAWFRLYGDLLGATLPAMQWGAEAANEPSGPPMQLADEAPRVKAMASPRGARASARVHPGTRNRAHD